MEKLAKAEPDDALPAPLRGNRPAAVLYNNLPDILAAIPVREKWAATEAPAYGDECLAISLKLDEAMRDKAPADWKGDPTREAMVLNAIYPIMKKDRAATQAIFEIIKQQPDY